jgi:hypothetical protein
MRGDNCGKYTDIGEKYFEEFNTLFWLRPGNKRCLISLFTFIYIHNYIHFYIFLASAIQNVQRTNVSTHIRRNRERENNDA